MLKTVKELLPSAELPTEEREKIGRDAAALAADLKTLMPVPGAMSGVSFLNGHGIESYHYSWGEHPGLDGSKPLSLLEHIGGSPTIAAVARGKVSMQNYDLAAKWLGIGYGYFEKYAVPKMPEGEREKFQQFATSARPLVKRLHRTTRDMLLPALADGQFALVIDTKLKSKRFFPAQPAAEKPLAMLEPALVLGVSDAELLRKACGEYRDDFNGLIDAVRNVEGSHVPENLRIPEPTVLDRRRGHALYLPLAEGMGGEQDHRSQCGPLAERGRGVDQHRAHAAAARGHAAKRAGPSHPHRPAPGRGRRPGFRRADRGRDALDRSGGADRRRALRGRGQQGEGGHVSSTRSTPSSTC